jgi:arylsulfatase A-like enzyme
MARRTTTEAPVTAWDVNSDDSTAHWRNENRRDGQPFFSVFNFGATHESQAWRSASDTLLTDPDDVPVPPFLPDTDSVRQHIARHYDNIARVDSQIQRVLRQLEADGLAEETVVFFWSDHGDGLPRYKRWVYDSGIHVPLIVRWPGVVETDSVNRELVSSVDFGPTVLSIAGVDVPRHMQGRPFLGPQDEGERDYVYAARDRFDESYDMVRAVRGERYKYIRNYYPQQPYVLHIPYRNRNVTMRALLRGDRNSTLTETQQLWMRDTRPAEELYDVQPTRTRSITSPTIPPAARPCNAFERSWTRGWSRSTIGATWAKTGWWPTCTERARVASSRRPTRPSWCPG